MKNKSRFIGLLGYAAVAFIGAGISFMTLPKSVTPRPAKAGQTDKAVTQNTQPDSMEAFRLKSSKSESAATISSSKVVSCLGACLKLSVRLNDNARIDDENFESLQGQISEFAAYLAVNETARMEMLKLVMTTKDSNKRALVIDAFSWLPKEQQEGLGTELLKSDNWLVRTGGVNLFTASDNLTPDKAKALISVLTDDSHSHVQTTILKILKNSESLKGDPDTLNKLTVIMNSKVDSIVKSDALLTKLALHKNPLNAMPDTIRALTSKDPEVQTSALIALERIYEADKVKNGKLSQIDHSFVKTVLEDLIYVEVTAKNKSQIERLIKEVDAFYARNFQ